MNATDLLDKSTDRLIEKQDARIAALEAENAQLREAVLQADKRLTPFSECWKKDDAELERDITLDDLALADAWRDMYSGLTRAASPESEKAVSND